MLIYNNTYQNNTLELATVQAITKFPKLYVLIHKIKNDNYNDNDNTNINMSQKLLICIYTNKDRNEFAIGLKKDENFRAMTKEGEFYTRFVDAFDKIVDNENETDWKQELQRWIDAAKKNETIFVEVDLSKYNVR